MTTVELLGKAGCCLCDDAKVVLERVRARIPFQLVIVDIGDDDALLARYGNEVPVLLIDGRKAFKYRIDEDELVRRLERRAS